MYQSLLCSGNRTTASALTDGLSEAGGEPPEGEGVGPGDEAVGGALGPRVETHVMVAGR
jgi:hypothetical protein